MLNTDPDQYDLIPVQNRFPSHLIQAFGFGKVDRVYVSLDQDGRVQFAEAELIEAPYKRMLITVSELLRIFGEGGETIDVTVLNPCPKFRLDPVRRMPEVDEALDISIFDVACLVDIMSAWHLSSHGTL
ncbi:hypothetical protein EK21DRAFT_119741 [Setomelanomma holmii]|uniref:Uncharacterized protein n=1 Tax=Setomelanomma holmii TaxID=210430 RepID=A0A9P4GWF8_9PLEO|nr:hypothetical protein EK21DRAFT_119741 [Setomelanomma holmii]